MLQDEYWMNMALKEARTAAEAGEVPIGAVIVKQDKLIAKAHNLRESTHDPTAHAEMLVIREASRKLHAWRLAGCTLYVTLEPCPMCAGSLVQSRIDRLVYGADDPKAGCTGTLLNLVQFPAFNHDVIVQKGILQDECADILKQFFSNLRKKS